MAEDKGFTIELTSRFGDWWRYNAALMCGCFDAAGERTAFASAASHVADVGSNLAARPADTEPGRRLRLSAPACDHLMLYVYIVPHTLPVSNEIDATRPFEVELKISFAGKRLRQEKFTVNQWSGASREMRIEAPGSTR